MQYKYYILFALTLANVSLLAIDNAHFYRATNMFLEPRLEHDYLTTFAATLGGGDTTKGRSCNNTLVPLFDIYGRQAFQELNANTPFQNPNDPFDQLLINLSKLPMRDGFATISIDARFSALEANLSLAQNLAHGLFLFFHMPVRRLTVSDVQFIDRSPDDGIFPNKNTPIWQTVFSDIRPLLAHYGINSCPTTSTGVGDLSSWIGCTHNYQETRKLDFIDFTFMAGVLAPTGKKRDENELFSFPTGYDGHWGFGVSPQASIGFYEWVTLGGYFNALLFLKKEKTMRLKTNVDQSGIIKLASANVADHRGPLINTGFYIKADHVGHNVSVTAAYSFASQRKSHLSTHNNQLDIDSAIINSDAMLKGWNMHTLNFLAEYDFAREGNSVGNRIGLFYNLQVAGSRVFDTNMFGGTYGIDISLYM